MAVDLAASAAMAVEGNLPKPLKLSGNFHYVCPLLAVVEINVVFFPLFLKFDNILIMIEKPPHTFGAMVTPQV